MHLISSIFSRAQAKAARLEVSQLLFSPILSVCSLRPLRPLDTLFCVLICSDLLCSVPVAAVCDLATGKGGEKEALKAGGEWSDKRSAAEGN